jgi:hypothetical protein
VTTKYVMRYHEAPAPIRSLTTKFGGQPVWLEEPCWPLSRMNARPMHFICQIVLDPGFLPETPARMAYLFMTDWDYESPYPNTFDPDDGENALLLQPGGRWSGPSSPLQEGPSLYRRFHRGGRWEQSPREVAVELDRGDDPVNGAWQGYPQEEAARERYWAALSEDKIGGIPVPTPFERRFGPDFDGWRLLLQLNAKDNAEESDPFFLNVAYDAVVYAFVSLDGRSGKVLWER